MGLHSRDPSSRENYPVGCRVLSKEHQEQQTTEWMFEEGVVRKFRKQGSPRHRDRMGVGC